MKLLQSLALAAALQVSVTAFGESIDPPDCPIGYHCVPKDPLATQQDPLAIQQCDQEDRRRARAQCQERKRAEEQLLAGQAAMADPGNPYAVSSAVGMADTAIDCGD